MSILLIGLNHRTAPVEVREQLAFSRDGVATALMLLRNQFPGAEASILSTCNRVEILIATENDRPTAQDVISFIAQARDLPANEFKNYLYQFCDEQAIRHLFRVAGGLDSMVLGESQIVSQLKQAYAQAMEQGTTGRVLNRLFHHAFEVGKRVRTDTDIAEGKLSGAIGRSGRRPADLRGLQQQANTRRRRRRDGATGLPVPARCRVPQVHRNEHAEQRPRWPRRATGSTCHSRSWTSNSRRPISSSPRRLARCRS